MLILEAVLKIRDFSRLLLCRPANYLTQHVRERTGERLSAFEQKIVDGN
jgi:hypothetical protein